MLELEEAKSVTRATMDTSTVVTVATSQRDELLTEGEGPNQTTPYSLANVLRLRRPFVIVDEAHNSRTELAFDMLARFRLSGVMEMIKLPVLLETEPE